MRLVRRSLVTITALELVALAFAGSPVGWRLDGTGRYPDAKPPTEWAAGSATQPAKNILWVTSMPDRSNSSPVLVGGRLFVQSEPFDLVCVDAKDGTILWTKSNDYAEVMTPADVEQAKADKAKADAIRGEIAPLQKQIWQIGEEAKKLAARTTQPAANAEKIKAEQKVLKEKAAKLNAQIARLRGGLAGLTKWERLPTNEVNGYSSPTPVSDGQFVYALFGNGVAASYDLEGHRRWIRFVAKSPIEDGHASSPVLVEGQLLVHVDDLIALDPETGKTLWEADRTEPGFGTPAVVRLGGVTAAVTANGDVVRVADGVVLARKVSLVSYCSPVVDNSIAYFVQNISRGHGGGHVVKLSAPAGDAVKAEVLWQTTSARDRYYASPVIADGLIYAVTQAKVFSVINAADGQVVKELRLILGKGTTFPSICLAGGLLFVSHDSGNTAVVRPGRDAEVIRVNTLEPFRSTPLFVSDRIYIRGFKNLYCIGAAAAGSAHHY